MFFCGAGFAVARGWRYPRSFSPATMVSGQKLNTEAISPAMQKPQSEQPFCRTKKVFQREQHIASVVFSSAIVYSYLSVLYGKNGLRREFLAVSPRIRYDNRCDDRQKTEHIRSISLKTLKIAGFLPAKSNE